MSRTVTCYQCDVLVINNVVCHEYGCPDAWKDDELECLWCGQKFKPENRNQDCCSTSCLRAYCM